MEQPHPFPDYVAGATTRDFKSPKEVRIPLSSSPCSETHSLLSPPIPPFRISSDCSHCPHCPTSDRLHGGQVQNGIATAARGHILPHCLVPHQPGSRHGEEELANPLLFSLPLSQAMPSLVQPGRSGSRAPLAPQEWRRWNMPLSREGKGNFYLLWRLKKDPNYCSYGTACLPQWRGSRGLGNILQRRPRLPLVKFWILFWPLYREDRYSNLKIADIQ